MPWWQREGVISRVLAVAGVGVTLVGVLMLLVLAAQAGFFGPVARVVAGGGLSVVLVGLETFLTSWTEHWKFFLGPILILIVLFSTGGLTSLFSGWGGKRE